MKAIAKSKIRKTASYLILIAIALFYHPQQGFAQASTSVGFSKLEGYAVRPGMEPAGGMTTQLFARREQFDQNFVPAPLKGRKAPYVDFNRFVVLACIAPKTNVETTLTLQKIRKNNGIMEVYFLSKTGNKSKNAVAPCCLYTTAVDKSLSSIVYYLNGKVYLDLRN